MRYGIEELLMTNEKYDLFGYRNDNGEPPQVKTAEGLVPMTWWAASTFNMEVFNTILLRYRFPDFFEMPCWKEEMEGRVPNRVAINLTSYQQEQVEKGNAIAYSYWCKCGDVKFVCLQPTSEVSKYAPEVGYHQLPPYTFNSGPTPM